MGKELVNLLLARLGYPTLEGLDLQLEELRLQNAQLQDDLGAMRGRLHDLQRERYDLRETVSRKHGEVQQLTARVVALEGPTTGGLSTGLLREELRALTAITEKAVQAVNERIQMRYIVTDERGAFSAAASALRGLHPRLKALLQQLEGP